MGVGRPEFWRGLLDEEGEGKLDWDGESGR